MKAGKREGYLHPIEKVEVPFHTLHMDHLGPFNPSSGGKRHILAIIDAFTKFIFLHAVKSTNTAAVTRYLPTLINIYGVPNRIVTDRGTAFTSGSFQEFCLKKGIKHILTAVATPRANGQVERYNATILQALASSINSERDWEKKLHTIKFVLNNTKNASTGSTPSEILMGYKPRAPADAPLTVEIQPERPVVKNLKEKRADVSRKIAQDQKKQKIRFDRHRLRPRQYKDGDLVVVLRKPVGDGGSRKLLPKFKGPFKIEKVLPNDRYAVVEIPGSTRSKKAPFKSIESVEHLKRWMTKGDMSSSSEDYSD